MQARRPAAPHWFRGRPARAATAPSPPPGCKLPSPPRETPAAPTRAPRRPRGRRALRGAPPRAPMPAEGAAAAPEPSVLYRCTAWGLRPHPRQKRRRAVARRRLCCMRWRSWRRVRRRGRGHGPALRQRRKPGRTGAADAALRRWPTQRLLAPRLYRRKAPGPRRALRAAAWSAFAARRRPARNMMIFYNFFSKIPW